MIDQTSASPPIGRRMMAILWPAFVGAGVLCGVVFSLIDPYDVAWAGRSIELSRLAAYTLGFLLFWLIASAVAWCTALLLDDRSR
ncbi:MAG: hypothetical protein ABIU95_13780 [Burkholderiales bacterium]